MLRATFVYGGWEGHQPKETAELFAGLLDDAGVTVKVTDDLDELAAGGIADIDLVVPVVTMGALTPQQETGLVDAVRGGTAIGGWHGGMVDAFRTSTTYQWMVGGQFVAHPGGFVSYQVEPCSDDPIVAGLGPFTVTTEQYYLHVDPSNHVLATTTFDGKHADWIEGVVMPVAWRRRFGAGRVFHCTLGHWLPDFDVDETREILRRGLLWAAGA
ncbi:MAG: ThuA domain-containing protein [Frankiaceae bacterium]|nr:ThuA domain-containing protein [Frankiaceae bacterium]